MITMEPHPRASQWAIAASVPISSMRFSYRSASHRLPQSPLNFRGVQKGPGTPSSVTGGSSPLATRVLLMSATASAALPRRISPSAFSRSISATVMMRSGPVL